MSNRSKRGTTTMTMNGLGLTVHSPLANKTKRDGRGEEVANNLTPPAPVTVYSVADFPNCPEDWKRGDPAKNMATYFMRTKIGNQLWFDMRQNNGHAHEVASLVTCQRINAISGLPVAGNPGLEQYYFICPKHDVGFEGKEKYCPRCKHNWPHQNYISTNMNNPNWLDGVFDGKTGKIREFVFTDEVARSFAAKAIGDERVNAFSVRLYLSQEPKPRPVYSGYRHSMHSYDDLGLESLGGNGLLGGGRMRSMGMSVPPTIDVAAGALIKQEIGRDKNRPDFWQKDPSAFFVVYFVGQEEFRRIVGHDIAEEDGPGDGFLEGLPVGND